MKKAILAYLSISAVFFPAFVLGQIYPILPYDIWVQARKQYYYPYTNQSYPSSSNTSAQIALQNPNGGEFWRVGETRPIYWQTTCFSGNQSYSCTLSYDVYLIGSGCTDPRGCSMSPLLIASGVKTDSINWYVGQTKSGTRVGSYRVAVCYENYLTGCDVSDSSFTIDNPAGYQNPPSQNLPDRITYITPVPGSDILNSTQTFSWNRVASADEYWVQIGYAVGAKDIYDRSIGTNTSVTISNLPMEERIYFRLWYRKANVWSYSDFSYVVGQGQNLPTSIVEISPSAGSVLGSRTTFVWNRVQGASEYWVQLGQAIGGKNIFDRSVGTFTTVTISDVPSYENLYLRVWYRTGNNWLYRDFTYKTSITSSNKAPVISLRTSIPLGQTLSSPAGIPLEANAYDPNGSIALVEFYQNGVWIGADTVTPFAFTASNVGTGSHSFTAVATDNDGLKTTSSPLFAEVFGGGVSSQVPVLQIWPNSSYSRAPAVFVLSLGGNFDLNIIGKVVFYKNGLAVDEDRTLPFQYAVADVSAGSYTFKADIYGLSGAYIGTTNQISVNVGY